jgi:hypothetical protein
MEENTVLTLLARKLTEPAWVGHHLAHPVYDV